MIPQITQQYRPDAATPRQLLACRQDRTHTGCGKARRSFPTRMLEKLDLPAAISEYLLLGWERENRASKLP
jgi:hypothetical protein